MVVQVVERSLFGDGLNLGLMRQAFGCEMLELDRDDLLRPVGSVRVGHHASQRGDAAPDV